MSDETRTRNLWADLVNQIDKSVLNGTSINDYANSAPGSVLGLDLGADAVEQVSVITSNYPADYGRSLGGVINAVTHSGSNRFHFSLYEFFRNDNHRF